MTEEFEIINLNVPRKKRQALTLDILRRIRKQLEKSNKVCEIAEDVEMTRCSIYKVINKISEGLTDEQILLPKKGRKKNEFSEIKSKISQILLKDSSFNQSEISQQLKDFGIIRGPSTVCRTLKKMEYTRKRLVKIPEERNAPRNIDARQKYAREVQFIGNEHLIFLDETGMNLHQTRNYGYSPKNYKAYKLVKGSRGKNISCMVAIKITGIIAFEIKDGAFNGESFMKFIEEKLLLHFQSYPNDVLVMDNCSFHHRRDVIEMLNCKNINHRFLPPYSPQLNPIEEYFSHFKAVLAGIHPLPRNKEELKVRICNTINSDRIDFCGWYNHMRKYIEYALARHEFI